MILTAHQPLYLPWLGFFHKVMMADKFCLFDRVQYQNKDFNNRNKIKTQAGEVMLSVPIESKNHFEKKLCDVKIVPGSWNRKHFKSIQFAYKKAPFFDLYIDSLDEILQKQEFKFLVDLDVAFLRFLFKSLQIDVEFVKASDFNFEGAKSELVLDMCRKLGATSYIFGSQGVNYADVDAFNLAQIKPIFQAYEHPIYNQLHGDFKPGMSVIDLLFNEGPRSREIIMQGNQVLQRSVG